jgi:transposase InsO family protein
MAYKSFKDAAAHFPYFIGEVYNKRRLHSAFGRLSPTPFKEKHPDALSNSRRTSVRPRGPPHANAI